MLDQTLLTFVNQTLAHPILDVLMLIITISVMGLLPASGVVLLRRSHTRRLGLTIVLAIVLAVAWAMIFQQLSQRSRPVDVRVLYYYTPNFPSYPSGHAAGAFAWAVVCALAYRRGWAQSLALCAATIIALSRVYLGVHYPSDIVAGAVVGAAIGATCYGLLLTQRERWRWLLWSQLALVFLAIHMAYLGILPYYLLRWPFADKVLHMLLIGGVVFWLNLWWGGHRLQVGRLCIPTAIVVVLVIATAEELFQAFSPLRTLDLYDWLSDLVGIALFWWLSEWVGG